MDFKGGAFLLFLLCSGNAFVFGPFPTSFEDKDNDNGLLKFLRDNLCAHSKEHVTRHVMSEDITKKILELEKRELFDFLKSIKGDTNVHLSLSFQSATKPHLENNVNEMKLDLQMSPANAGSSEERNSLSDSLLNLLKMLQGNKSRKNSRFIAVDDEETTESEIIINLSPKNIPLHEREDDNESNDNNSNNKSKSKELEFQRQIPVPENERNGEPDFIFYVPEQNKISDASQEDVASDSVPMSLPLIFLIKKNTVDGEDDLVHNETDFPISNCPVGADCFAGQEENDTKDSGDKPESHRFVPQDAPVQSESHFFDDALSAEDLHRVHLNNGPANTEVQMLEKPFRVI